MSDDRVAKRVVELNPARADLLLALDNAPTRQGAAAKNIPIVPWTEAKGIAGARTLDRASDAKDDEVRFEDAESSGAIELTLALVLPWLARRRGWQSALAPETATGLGSPVGPG